MFHRSITTLAAVMAAFIITTGATAQTGGNKTDKPVTPAAAHAVKANQADSAKKDSGVKKKKKHRSSRKEGGAKPKTEASK